MPGRVEAFSDGVFAIAITLLSLEIRVPHAAASYCGTFVINGIAWNLLFTPMVRDRLLRPEIGGETIARIRRAYVFGPVVYAVSTVVALFPPVLGLVLNASLLARVDPVVLPHDSRGRALGKSCDVAASAAA